MILKSMGNKIVPACAANMIGFSSISENIEQSGATCVNIFRANWVGSPVSYRDN
jgi:hypothetical protein